MTTTYKDLTPGEALDAVIRGDRVEYSSKSFESWVLLQPDGLMPISWAKERRFRIQLRDEFEELLTKYRENSVGGPVWSEGAKRFFRDFAEYLRLDILNCIEPSCLKPEEQS